jgi:hypothetical protein
MKQKWRYNIRLAERRGVQVRAGTADEYPLFFRLYAETATRDGFLIRPEAYYLDLWRTFQKEGLAHLLLAEVEGAPIAGMILFRFGESCGRSQLGQRNMTYGVPQARLTIPTMGWRAFGDSKAGSIQNSANRLGRGIFR